MKRQLSEWEKMFANHISNKTLKAKTGVFPGDTSGKESTCQCRRCESCRFYPWVKKIPWSRRWQPTPGLLLGKFHGQLNLVGYSPWGCKDSDATERESKIYRKHTQLGSAPPPKSNLKNGEGGSGQMFFQRRHRDVSTRYMKRCSVSLIIREI